MSDNLYEVIGAYRRWLEKELAKSVKAKEEAERKVSYKAAVKEDGEIEAYTRAIAKLKLMVRPVVEDIEHAREMHRRTYIASGMESYSPPVPLPSPPPGPEPSPVPLPSPPPPPNPDPTPPPK